MAKLKLFGIELLKILSDFVYQNSHKSTISPPYSQISMNAILFELLGDFVVSSYYIIVTYVYLFEMVLYRQVLLEGKPAEHIGGFTNGDRQEDQSSNQTKK